MTVQTVACTACGINEVPAPVSIEEDPMCIWCLRAAVKRAADAVFRATETILPSMRYCSTGCGVQLGMMQEEDRCTNCRVMRRW